MDMKHKQSTLNENNLQVSAAETQLNKQLGSKVRESPSLHVTFTWNGLQKQIQRISNHGLIHFKKVRLTLHTHGSLWCPLRRDIHLQEVRCTKTRAKTPGVRLTDAYARLMRRMPVLNSGAPSARSAPERSLIDKRIW